MFLLGAESELHLQGVKAPLVACVRRALRCSSQDFTVFEGLRSLERQAELVRTGASRTMQSKHLTGDAVDLVPWIAGRPQWQLPACCAVAIAMREAAEELDIKLRWGGVWDLTLHDLDPVALQREVNAYAERFTMSHPGKHPLIDGPHFELHAH